MFRSLRKKTVETEGKTEDVKVEEELGFETTEDADEVEVKPSSFLKSLWAKKFHKDEANNGDDQEKYVSGTIESPVEPGGSEPAKDDKAKPSQRSRLMGFFRGKGAVEEEEETIEVEDRGNKNLQIHDSSRTFNSQRSTTSYNPNCLSVFDEALEMLTASLLIYIFADLREMAREGVIDAKELLEDPTPVRKVLHAIKDHRGALETRAIDHDQLSEKLNLLKEVHEQSAQSQTGNSTSSRASATIGHLLQGDANAALAAMATQQSLEKTKESVLDQFHDEKSTQGVVYGIAINHVRKRVTIIFRGSVTQQDFLTDSRSAQKKVPNPITSVVNEAPEHIQIHTGFYTYLFAKDKNDKQRLLCQRILAEVKRLLKENPGYQLYCTGHSLGGALATLCGFYAAVDDELIQYGPVVVISVASPQVGHKTFCESFHALELLGRLQHLRVSNREDMITHLPFVHIKAHVLSPVAVAMFGAGNLYKHCGIHLELKSVQEESENRTEHFVCHPNKTRCVDAESYSEEFKRSMAAAKMLYESVVPLGKGDIDALTSFHSCKEYEARLMARKQHLQGVTLDELYRDEGIVGAALAQNLSEARLPLP